MKKTFQTISRSVVLGTVALTAISAVMASPRKKEPAAPVIPTHQIPVLPLTNKLDSLAYSYGAMFGTQYSNFTDSGVVVPEKVMNLDYFLDGFYTAITKQDSALRISATDARAYIEDFMAGIREMMEKEQAEKLAKTKAEGAAYMAANAKKEGVICLPSGVQVEHVVVGTGKAPSPESDVKVNYKGKLIDGKVFDANDEIDFSLSQMIRGFTEGVLQMKEGGKAIVTMPSDQAYGDRGAGSDIPAGSTLVFEIDLLEVK